MVDPEAIGKWMFDSPSERRSPPDAVGCARRRTFSFVVRRQGEEIEHAGEYSKSRSVLCSWGVSSTADRSRVTIDIVRKRPGPSSALTHELHPAWADYADRTKEA